MPRDRQRARWQAFAPRSAARRRPGPRSLDKSARPEEARRHNSSRTPRCDCPTPDKTRRLSRMALAVRTLENFVGGAWVAATGDSARPIVSPVTGETLAEAPDASPADVDAAVAAARRAQPAWGARS